LVWKPWLVVAVPGAPGAGALSPGCWPKLAAPVVELTVAARLEARALPIEEEAALAR
jgi:hypothetical protein